MIFDVNKYNYRVSTPEGHGKVVWTEYLVKENLNRVYVELDVNKSVKCFDETSVEITVKESRCR